MTRQFDEVISYSRDESDVPSNLQRINGWGKQGPDMNVLLSSKVVDYSIYIVLT